MTRILVVCSGNICRSPLAEAAIARRIEGHDSVVTSAGTIAEVGQPATSSMREVASAHGLDLSGHRATALADVAQPDIAFGMETRHLVAVRRAFPDLDPAQIRLLDHPHDVADPYGRGRDAYRVAADQIVEAVERLDAAALGIG